MLDPLCDSAALVPEMLDPLCDSAALVHDSERRWRVSRSRVEHLVGQSGAGGT